MASADPTEFEEIAEHSQDNYHSDQEVDPEAPTQVIEENGKINKQVCINVRILLLNPPPSLKIGEFNDDFLISSDIFNISYLTLRLHPFRVL